MALKRQLRLLVLAIFSRRHRRLEVRGRSLQHRIDAQQWWSLLFDSQNLHQRRLRVTLIGAFGANCANDELDWVVQIKQILLAYGNAALGHDLHELIEYSATMQDFQPGFLLPPRLELRRYPGRLGCEAYRAGSSLTREVSSSVSLL